MEYEKPIGNSDKDEKTPNKRSRREAFNFSTNEVQSKVSKQNHKLDKLYSLTEKLFTLIVEKQPPPSKKDANEVQRNNDSCNQSIEGR